MLAEKNDAIYNYVSACTVDRRRINIKKRISDSDYFLKGNDFDYELLKKAFKVHGAVKINDSLSIVPIGNEKPYAIVFVQKTKDGWRIIKVEDTFPGSDMPWGW